jgi:ribonuclease Z
LQAQPAPCDHCVSRTCSTVLTPELYLTPANVTSVEVTFLGTGAAFAPSAYNSSILVDRVILLDAGAPLTVHLPKVGVSLAEPRAVVLSHFHADHTFGLAWLMLGRVLLLESPPPLQVFGPRGTTAYLEQLLDLAWGEDMRRMSWERLQLQVQELAGGEGFEIDGSQGQAYQMQHTSRLPCLGFVLRRDGVRLGYTGDAEMSAQLDELIAASDHVISEMTYDDDDGDMHLGRKDIAALMGRHPRVRFILTHRGSNGVVSGAVMASDFLTLQLPLP